MPVRLERWTAKEMRPRLDEVIGVYADAMGYPRGLATARRATFAEHTERSDYLAVAALEGPALVGIGYGYRSAPGQWWHEQVRRAAERIDTAAMIWLSDAFEIAELHVVPTWQGQGIGRSLLADLPARSTHERVLLSTPEGPTRAWSLYRSVGFVDVLRHHHFPGDGRPFAILGLERPGHNHLRPGDPHA
ncbi:MAG: GNAT family N-acetyltransferase [Mycobacteriales bacterium]